MKRYFVEIGWDNGSTLSLYVFAYSDDQIREMFKTYRLITVDITD